jgi:hypothetical protein
MNQKPIIATQCKHREIKPTCGIKFWDNYSVPETLFLHLAILGPIFFCLTASFIGTYKQAENHIGIFTFAPKCLFKMITGHPCITCGMSRAFCAISHGQFNKAIEFNIFSPILYIIFLILAFIGVLSLFIYTLSKRKLFKGRMQARCLRSFNSTVYSLV